MSRKANPITIQGINRIEDRLGDVKALVSLTAAALRHDKDLTCAVYWTLNPAADILGKLPVSQELGAVSLGLCRAAALLEAIRSSVESLTVPATVELCAILIEVLDRTLEQLDEHRPRLQVVA